MACLDRIGQRDWAEFEARRFLQMVEDYGKILNCVPEGKSVVVLRTRQLINDPFNPERRVALHLAICRLETRRYRGERYERFVARLRQGFKAFEAEYPL